LLDASKTIGIVSTGIGIHRPRNAEAKARRSHAVIKNEKDRDTPVMVATRTNFA